jgi:pimeloyl-ACP methyl ester carboxylesterase
LEFRRVHRTGAGDVLEIVCLVKKSLSLILAAERDMSRHGPGPRSADGLEQRHSLGIAAVSRHARAARAHPFKTDPMELWQIILLVILLLVIFWIAGTAIFAALVTRQYPPIGNFLECNGVRLHYVERGNQGGPALVLLHGNGAMVQDFIASGVLDDAARRYRVLCFDRPGFGHSTRPRRRIWTPEAEAELFAEALHRLRVERAVVIGHSWGALVALALGLGYPDLVQGLVLASGYYFPTPRKDVWLLSGPAIPVLGDLMRYTISPPLAWFILPKMLKKIFAPRAVSDRFLREFPLPLTVRPLQLRAAAEETALMIPAAARLEQRYSELTCPVALIAGDKDQIVDPNQAARLHGVLSRHYASPNQLIEAAALMLSWPEQARSKTSD